MLLSKSSMYCSLTKSNADLSPCYKFLVKNQRADVLLVGDSALLYGVKPEIVERYAHRSSYNYGIVGPVFAFDPEKVINHYLETNARPMAVVVYLSPWDIVEPGHIDDHVWFPLGLQTMQHGNLADLLRLLRARPLALTELPQVVVQSVGFSLGRNDAARRLMEAERGRFNYGATIPAGRRRMDHCALPAGTTKVPDTSATGKAMARLKAHYAQRGLPVFFYVAPFAGCGVDEGAVRRAYVGLADNRPTAIADGYFPPETAKGPFVHVNDDGVEVVSRMLGQFIADLGVGERP